MRNQWYGDNRDLVKWSVVLNLAKERKLKRVIQIAMLCPSVWMKRAKGEPAPSPEALPFVQKNGAEWLRLSDTVVSHFRDLSYIQQLAPAAKVPIDLVDTPFTHKSRTEYFDNVTDRLQGMAGHPALVFIDPDTGIAPRTHDAKHIRADELKRVYHAAPPGSTILLYQHARQHVGQAQWMRDTLQEFTAALSLQPDQIERYYCPDIAHDVAFLAARKPKD
mgnify:CR=1 FL=1